MTKRSNATRLRSLIRWGLPLSFVVLLGFLIAGRLDTLSVLSEVTASQVMVLLMATFIGHLLNATEFWHLYNSLGAKLTHRENYLLFAAGQLGNYLPAQAGTVFRFKYLERIHSMPLTTVTAGYGANMVLTLLSTGFVGLAALISLGITDNTWSWSLLIAFAGTTVVSIVLCVAPVPVADPSANRVRRALGSIGAGWAQVRGDRRLMTTVIALEVTKYLLAAWRMQLAFGWLGDDQPYLFFLVLAPVAGVATFVGFTPAAIGFRELSISGAAVAMGRAFDAGLLGAAVDRAALMVVATVAGGIGLVWCGRRLQASTIV